MAVQIARTAKRRRLAESDHQETLARARSRATDKLAVRAMVKAGCSPTTPRPDLLVPEEERRFQKGKVAMPVEKGPALRHDHERDGRCLQANRNGLAREGERLRR